MTLSQLRTLARAYIPAAKSSVLDNTTLDLILNNAVVDIAAYTCCLKTNKKFAVVADQSEYNISSVIGDYLVSDKPGLWWNAGTASAPNWIKIDSATMKSLDNDQPVWRDLESGNPDTYSIDGDILTISPPPDTSLADGFWLYYGKAPVAMSSNDSYPFSGSATEYTHLMIFDESILRYAKWRVDPVFGKEHSNDVTEAAYKREREEKFQLFKQRRDISSEAQLNI